MPHKRRRRRNPTTSSRQPPPPPLTSAKENNMSHTNKEDNPEASQPQPQPSGSGNTESNISGGSNEYSLGVGQQPEISEFVFVSSFDETDEIALLHAYAMQVKENKNELLMEEFDKKSQAGSISEKLTTPGDDICVTAIPRFENLFAVFSRRNSINSTFTSGMVDTTGVTSQSVIVKSGDVNSDQSEHFDINGTSNENISSNLDLVSSTPIKKHEKHIELEDKTTKSQEQPQVSAITPIGFGDVSAIESNVLNTFNFNAEEIIAELELCEEYLQEEFRENRTSTTFMPLEIQNGHQSNGSDKIQDEPHANTSNCLDENSKLNDLDVEHVPCGSRAGNTYSHLSKSELIRKDIELRKCLADEEEKERNIMEACNINIKTYNNTKEQVYSPKVVDWFNYKNLFEDDTLIGNTKCMGKLEVQGLHFHKGKENIAIVTPQIGQTDALNGRSTGEVLDSIKVNDNVLENNDTVEEKIDNDVTCLGKGKLLDLMSFFCKTECELSRICNWMVRDVTHNHGHLLTNLDQPWLSTNKIEILCMALQAKKCPYHNCFGFLDGTVRAICRPKVNQGEYYNGHKRVHAVKFQSLLLPNGLIGNMYGQVNGRRHDAHLLQCSDLISKLERKFAHPGKCYHIYADTVYPLKRIS